MKKVIVVEDEPLITLTVVDMIDELGYEVVADYVSAEKALEAINGGLEFDILFTDLNLPGMHGDGLTKILREKHPGLPVIMASGYTITSGEYLAEPFAVVKKPYWFDDLKEAFQKVDQ